MKGGEKNDEATKTTPSSALCPATAGLGYDGVVESQRSGLAGCAAAAAAAF